MSNPRDWNGHVPDTDAMPDHDEMLCQGCLSEFAVKAIAPLIEAQESVYRLAEVLGISRAELDRAAGITEGGKAA